MAAATFAWQTWNSLPFTIERKAGKAEGTVLLEFCGPFWTRDVYTNLPTTALAEALGLDGTPGGAPISKHILDMGKCPSIDSSGLGIIATHHVRCEKRGVKLVVAAASPRVRQVFQITNMDKVIPMVGTVEEAERQ
jgi:ABC-type transporter Mla MlaB component